MKNTMSDEFLDWLDQCPCQWFLDSHEEGSGQATYTFVENSENNEKDFGRSKGGTKMMPSRTTRRKSE